MITLILCLSLLQSVRANSFGKPTTTLGCDAHSNYGCNVWKKNSDGSDDCLTCTDPTQGYMPWVRKPVRTDSFTVSAPVTSYVGGGNYIPITVTANVYDLKFVGLLLHAVDKKNLSVGYMVFPDTSLGGFQSPAANCPHAALHKDASLKPFKTVFRFQTPPEGTGTITIRCLIKTGPANTGEFWWPNTMGDIVLTEAPPPPDTYVKWYISYSFLMTQTHAIHSHRFASDAGGNCYDKCKSVWRDCDSSLMDSVTTASALDTAISKTFLGLCKFPYLEVSELSHERTYPHHPVHLGLLSCVPDHVHFW